MASEPRQSEGVKKVRFERSDFPQLGWIGTPNLTLYEPTKLGAWAYQPQSFRMSSGKVYRRDTNQNLGWLQYVPSANDWHCDTTVTGRGKVYRRDTNQNLDWITANVPAGAVFDPALQNWRIDTVRTQAKGYQRDTNHDLGWLPANVPSPATFDPSTAVWSIDTVRPVPGQDYRRDANHDLGWLPANVPFDPALQGWWIQTVRTAPGKVYQRDTNLDNAWIDTAIPVPFNAALFPGVSQLSGVRTAKAPVLQPTPYQFYFDLSWVHDVIPLTDPDPAVATVIPRPIAPIMSARRRNRRRR